MKPYLITIHGQAIEWHEGPPLETSNQELVRHTINGVKIDKLWISPANIAAIGWAEEALNEEHSDNP